eukprot:scaffold8301_cov184-Cylindrotheca_fusiformis.AAC.9
MDVLHEGHGERKREPPKRTKSVGAADDLVCVSVKKTDPNQKIGIKLAQRPGGLYITGILDDGLFDGSEIEIGDRVLSLNGQRLKPGESISDFMSNMSTFKEKVTIVVKKVNVKTSRNARSMSPGRRRKKLVKKQGARKADGSFDYEINPTLEAYEKATSDDRDDEIVQHRIRAQKLYPKQNAGVLFKKIGEMLFVNGIALDSIYRDTVLAVGDRVVSVNDVNFMSYADAAYATTLLKRGNKEVSLVVEKGWKKLNMEKDVDKNHNLPSKDSIATNKNDSKDKSVKVPHRRPSTSKKKRRRESAKSTSTDADGSRLDAGKVQGHLMIQKLNSKSGPARHKTQTSNGLRFMEHKGDFMCITILKKSEKSPGIKVKEAAGIFVLKKLPSYEKRVPLGSRILAINGYSQFSSVNEAKDLIDRTEGKVVLIIDYEQPVLQTCPCCGKWMTTNGEHHELK